ncbi:MAG: response regulator [Gemmataceae bacterium]
MPDRPLTVLIVDDNAEAARSLALLLEMHGLTVEVVSDGPAALGRVDGAASPDVVLLDIELPGMDGCDVARQLRGRLGERTPRLVALTGRGRAEDVARGLEAGFDVYLVKPADPDQVLQAITPGRP